MIDRATIDRLMTLCSKPVALGGWLGTPYEQNGCHKFVIRFYRELGIELTEDAFREPKNFIDVNKAEFGDIAVFYDPSASESWHVGVMLNYRRMIQCGQTTNGVGKLPIDLLPEELFRGFKRHKALCS